MVGYGMPREGDVYGVAFTDDPSRCWRVHPRPELASLRLPPAGGAVRSVALAAGGSVVDRAEL
jgi:hypothetical protein